LLDVECSGLLQPIDDNVWQSGEFFEDSAQSFSDTQFRRRGPAFECTGHSIFGFFFPLMTILGQIIDLKFARSHPRFGTKTDWDAHALDISQQLVAYGDSVQELRNRAVDEANAEVHEPAHPGTPSAISVSSTISKAQESLVHAKIVEAYGTHLMHTLHILLNGKWDPISLLDDNDLWISSQSFVDATGHAVSAAEALNEILEYDPDLSFMPFFFGMYLLQGSFLLLLIADKLRGEANSNIVRACEVIVRAHEACIVTLDTEYQVSNSTKARLDSHDHGDMAPRSVDHTNKNPAAKFSESHALCSTTSSWPRHGRTCRTSTTASPGDAESLPLEW
jgi:hypothetical protein